MTDYISREAVKQIIAAQCGECADACLEFDGIQPDCNQCLLYGAKKAIESIPAADVRPVRRGEWTTEHLASTGGGTYAVVRCSECSSQFPMWRTNFCPNCGADMRPTSMSGANREES